MSDRSDSVRLLNGSEEFVVCEPGDRFSGVSSEWLIPRLRLDPKSSPIEGGFEIYLDEEDLCFPDLSTDELGAEPFGSAEYDGNLISVGIGESFGMWSEIKGNWIRSGDAEIGVSHVYTADTSDLSSLALKELSEILNFSDAITIEEDNDLSITSPFIDPMDEQVVSQILAMAPNASSISINGERVK